MVIAACTENLLSRHDVFVKRKLSVGNCSESGITRDLISTGEMYVHVRPSARVCLCMCMCVCLSVCLSV